MPSRDIGLWPRHALPSPKGKFRDACPVCHRLDVPVDGNGIVKHHRDPDGYVCEGSGQRCVLKEAKPRNRIQSKDLRE